MYLFAASILFWNEGFSRAMHTVDYILVYKRLYSILTALIIVYKGNRRTMTRAYLSYFPCYRQELYLLTVSLLRSNKMPRPKGQCLKYRNVFYICLLIFAIKALAVCTAFGPETACIMLSGSITAVSLSALIFPSPQNQVGYHGKV